MVFKENSIVKDEYLVSWISTKFDHKIYGFHHFPNHDILYHSFNLLRDAWFVVLLVHHLQPSNSLFNKTTAETELQINKQNEKYSINRALLS